ncbi:MAG: phosphate uptake regulator PhoU [Thaumarchaeota archaeon]|nr:phosphate uptake regulator PhoU [Nitrososphaerota archaeon]
MEARKLQTTAAGTFMVTIPKAWVSSLGLVKGGVMYLELEDREVVLSPASGRPPAQSRPLDIDKVHDRKMLELSISASYIQGHDITEIISKDKILPEQKRWIREAVDNLIGVEIAEEYADRVVLQNLVDPRMFDLDKSMKKFCDSTLAVLSDAIKGLRRGDKVLAQDAFERGYQSTKLYRLLMRLALQVLRNRKLRDELKVHSVESVAVKMMAIKDLGRSAYYAYRVAQHVTEMKEKLDSSEISLVEKMARVTARMQEGAFDAFVEKDLSLASSVIDRMDEVRKLYEMIYSSQLRKDQAGPSLPFTLIIRDVRGIAGYAVALADEAVLAAFD